MSRKVLIGSHASERFEERFAAPPDYLISLIESGRSLRLSGLGDAYDVRGVRSAHLCFIAETNSFCVALVDDRSGYIVTALTDEMAAAKSDWSGSVDDVLREKARQLATGDGSPARLLLAYAKRKTLLSMNVRIATVSNDWVPKVRPLMKIEISEDQIDASSNVCRLTDAQQEVVTSEIVKLVSQACIQPYGDVTVSNKQGLKLSVDCSFAGLAPLSEAETARRWLQS